MFLILLWLRPRKATTSVKFQEYNSNFGSKI